MAFLAALAPALGAVASGVAIATGIKSLVSKPPKQSAPPTPPKPPAPPQVADAEAAAEIDTKNRRRASLLTGGRTDLTRGKALVSPTDVGKKSLIGA